MPEQCSASTENAMTEDKSVALDKIKKLFSQHEMIEKKLSEHDDFYKKMASFQPFIITKLIEESKEVGTLAIFGVMSDITEFHLDNHDFIENFTKIIDEFKDVVKRLEGLREGMLTQVALFKDCLEKIEEVADIWGVGSIGKA